VSISEHVRMRAEELRKRCTDAIPSSYNPWVHLASTTGMGALTLAAAAIGIKALRPVEMLVIPATLLFANGFEWRVHRDVLHKRFWPFEELFERHTPVHHGVFHTDNMAMHTWREMRLVLLPAIGIVGIVVATGPLAATLATVLSPNAGWVFLATSATYMVSYELLHLAYHLPENHPIAQNAIMKKLRRHHAIHHDPSRMKNWNFNVSLPFFDWLLGTIAPET
jgi:hypothetical protein